MADDPDFHDLSYLLGHCLGRIDEEALRLIAGVEGCDPDAIAIVLEDETSRLQDLLTSIVSGKGREAIEQADLNHAVQSSVQALLQELPVPIVIRQRLQPELPPVLCAPGQLSCAVQRALVLASSHGGAGAEIELVTRAEDDGIVFELSCRQGATDPNLGERAVTLRAFVADIRGRCDVELDPTGTLLLAMSLPAALELDQN